MNIALYVRVSTARQQQSQTIEQQLHALQTHLASHPEWQLDDEHIYRDEGYSGAQLSRPGLDRLRDAAGLAAFEQVLITAPDRLARKYVHQVLLLEELQQVGCQVEFLERAMSDNPHDQLLLQIRGAVAEYERSLIADRMRRGRQAKLASGTLLPWTTPPYGYLVDPERPRDASRVQVDPVKAEVVKQIFAWFTDPTTPATLHSVAQQLTGLGLPTPRGAARWQVATVRYILRSSVYVGLAYSGRTRAVAPRRRKSPLQPVGTQSSIEATPAESWIAVPVPAIVSQETFDRAQQRLAHNKQGARRNNHAHEYLLRTLVSCGQCRLVCTGRSLPTGYHYYVCAGRTNTLRAAAGERCTARYIPARQLEQLVWEDLCQLLTTPELITHELTRAQAGGWVPQALQARRATLESTLAHLERQQGRLLDVYMAEVIERTEFERKRQELAQTQHALTQQLRQLEAQAQHHLDRMKVTAGIEAFCRRLQPTLDQLSFAQRRQLLELLVDCVIVNDEQVEIRYVIPTSPAGEESRFCHLRKDYFTVHPLEIVP